MASYWGSLEQMRRLNLPGIGGTTSPITPVSVKSFSEFFKRAGPTIFLHSQGLAVAVVFAGFTKGAVDATFFLQDQTRSDPERKQL
jgi:hypothetical protein